jgi:predicted transcriptional regulator
MKFVARDLLTDPEKPQLLAVTEDTALADALGLMLENDFSQAPVSQHRGDQPLQKSDVLGIVTRASCLQAMRQFSSLGINSLSIADVMVKAAYLEQDDEIDEVLGRLQSESSVLILDDHEQVLGIITHADTTRYFRQHADDVMRVRFIEETIKNLLLLAFNHEPAQICAAAPGPNQISTFIKAVQDYLGPEANPGFNVTRAKAVYKDHYDRPRGFDKLTLADFIGVLTSRDNWPRFERVFGDDTRRRAIIELLDNVRRTRNALAHFRDCSDAERETVRFAADWIDRHFGLASAVFEAAAEESDSESDLGGGPASEDPQPGSADTGEAPEAPSDDDEEQPQEPEIIDNPYGRLAAFLRALPQTERTAALSFDRIEGILQHRLPRNARQYRSWWANSVDQTQAKQWLEADWRVNRVNMSAESVVFGRIEARERQYIHFYSAMIRDLQNEHRPTWLTARNPRGTSWHTFADGRIGDEIVGRFNIAFGFEDRVRVEFYIDTRDAGRNRELFTQLQSELSSEQDLIWSLIEDKRACRVHIEREGSIRMAAEQLAVLRRQLTSDLVAFVGTFQAGLARLDARSSE